jgi:trehalose 6-phosphate phosphatase
VSHDGSTASGDGADLDDLDVLLAHVGDARRWTWVLDFDGTLAPIVDHPDAARPAPGAAEAVAALAEVCEVALLSGRSLDDLVERLGGIPPRVLLIGGHGSEARAPDGSRIALTDLEVAAEVLGELADRLDREVDPADGWMIERKSTSVAVHHRRVADELVAAQLPAVRSRLEAATDTGPGFVLLEGKAVLELKIRGVDKGRALRWIARVSADRAENLLGSPEIVPLVLGDDVTDEDAFAAADALGGDGVLISETPAATVARFRLREPARVVTLLEAARERLGGRAAAGAPHRTWRDATDAAVVADPAESAEGGP